MTCADTAPSFSRCSDVPSKMLNQSVPSHAPCEVSPHPAYQQLCPLPRTECWRDQSLPPLWQLVGTTRVRRFVHSHRYWRSPARCPYAAWTLVGQIVTTVGPTSLAEVRFEMPGILRDLDFVEPRDELVVNDISPMSADSDVPSRNGHEHRPLTCDPLN